MEKFWFFGCVLCGMFVKFMIDEMMWEDLEIVLFMVDFGFDISECIVDEFCVKVDWYCMIDLKDF